MFVVSMRLAVSPEFFFGQIAPKQRTKTKTEIVATPPKINIEPENGGFQ